MGTESTKYDSIGTRVTRLVLMKGSNPERIGEIKRKNWWHVSITDRIIKL